MVTDRKIRSNKTPRIKRIWNIHNQPININYEVENKEWPSKGPTDGPSRTGTPMDSPRFTEDVSELLLQTVSVKMTQCGLSNKPNLNAYFIMILKTGV